MNIAFVPIRKSSKSIPLKNIKIFCGKPLIYWSIKALNESKNIDVIYVATDSEEFNEIVKSFEFNKVEIYCRESANAQDTSSSESVMLEFINKKNFFDTDIFFLVQATSPFTQPYDFDTALEIFKRKKADSLVTCVRKKIFFWNDNGTPINYDYKKRPRRQDFLGTYAENGAFYINTIFNIKKYKNRLSGNVAIYEMKEFTGLELDEENDWLAAEELMYKHILL